MAKDRRTRKSGAPDSCRHTSKHDGRNRDDQQTQKKRRKEYKRIQREDAKKASEQEE